MATRKSGDNPPPEDASKLPKIDQESMTEAVADERRPDLEQEAENGPKNVVRYTGLVSERRISRDDWEQAGVQEQDGVVWTKDTGNVVPLDSFSEQALQTLAHTGEFQIVRDE